MDQGTLLAYGTSAALVTGGFYMAWGRLSEAFKMHRAKQKANHPSTILGTKLDELAWRLEGHERSDRQEFAKLEKVPEQLTHITTMLEDHVENFATWRGEVHDRLMQKGK